MRAMPMENTSNRDRIVGGIPEIMEHIRTSLIMLVEEGDSDGIIDNALHIGM